MNESVPGNTGKRKRNPLDDLRLNSLKNFYAEVQQDIQAFNLNARAIDAEILRAESAEIDNEIEREEFNVFNLKIPYTHLYVEKLELLRHHGRLFYRTQDFLESIDEYIVYIQGCINAIKTEGGDALDMNQAAVDLESMSPHVNLQIHLIDAEMSVLVNLYENKDPFFKEALKEKLEGRPELLAWVMPFLNQNEDALSVALKTLPDYFKNIYEKSVLSNLTRIKEYFDDHVSDNLKFIAKWNALDQASYDQKLDLVSDYCFFNLSNLQKDTDTLAEYLQITDDCIHKINNSGETVEMKKMRAFLNEIKNYLSGTVHEVNRVMSYLVNVYAQFGNDLNPKLRAFIAPWLEVKHADPLSASIEALKSFEVNVENEGEKAQVSVQNRPF